MSPLSLLTLAAGLACSQAPAPAPATPAFDLSALDRSADPCGDFYQFACGGWLAKNEIPPDQSRWGRFQELAERNRELLRGLLEKAPGKLGDHYAACMDEAAIERRGLEPLAPSLALLDAGGPGALPGELARLHLSGVGAGFGFGSAQDYKDASRMIAQADQGGLGLPDRDYYLKTDRKSEEQRRQYVEHVYRMLRLSGESEADAAADAEAVLRLETKLAAASQDLVFRRDPDHLYHKTKLADLASLAPGFDWAAYFEALGAPAFDSLNVVAPDYLKAVGALAAGEPRSSWRAYLRWHVLHADAAMLPSAFVNEDFDFYGRTLSGAKELKARWKRCVASADGQLGELLGRLYVEKNFGPAAKESTSRMVKALEKALQDDVSGLAWMTPATRRKALDKLAAIANKIGYPDAWRDYSSYAVSRDDALGNLRRGREFEARRELAKIGKPVDRKEWDMTPPTVNAYYDPQKNDINFPAGILQPPFYAPTADDAVNLGGIGAVIGHELTHGFDDEGRKFDGQGNLRDWWTAKDAKAFEARAQCLVDEYAQFTATEDVKLNGKLTLGENTADNGGLRLAAMALEGSLKGGKAAPMDGFTPRQRLFLGWGQVWCQKQSGPVARLHALTDPHSPGRYRVNGVLSNMPEFQKAFGCRAGSPMVSPKPCRVW